jgi:hypothetical protein
MKILRPVILFDHFRWQSVGCAKEIHRPESEQEPLLLRISLFCVSSANGTWPRVPEGQTPFLREHYFF